MLNFQDLPDEVVLKILSFSETKDLINCGQVSKRIRRISRDGTLWVTANLEKKIVKTELLEMILEKGCRILNLCHSTIHGSLSLDIKSQLRVLNLSPCNDDCDCPENSGVLEEILFSCCFLQHLVMERVFLTPRMADSICKNSKTLKILEVKSLTLDDSNLREIIKSCQDLKEIDLAYVGNMEGDINGYTDEHFEFLAENMSPNVEKLKLGGNSIMDYEVKILLSRCNKIKTLGLEATRITDDSFTIIRQHLNCTLEELTLSLGLRNDFLSFTGCLELKSMPRLKILNLLYENGDGEKIQNLRQHLSHLMIKVSSPFFS
jgi:hypothetical protein